jgi:hypothetical protein
MKRIQDAHWQRLAMFGMTQSRYLEQVRDLFCAVHGQYAKNEGKARWVDKTPHYALILEFIDQLYSDCQVIHCVRDPRDVVDSHRRRWGLKAAWTGANDWPSHVRAARAFGRSHSDDRFFEVRYEELTTDTSQVMRNLLTWLEEPWDESVLAPKPKLRELSEEEWRRRWLDQGFAGAKVPRRVELSGEFKSDPFISSIGIGSRGMGRLINAPLYLWLELRAGRLIRELNYE